jgi:hypothetical protein
MLTNNSKFHWGLEVLTKEKLTTNIVAIQDTARNLLSSTEVKLDVLGFPYPILGPNRRLNGDDQADIHTLLQYKLIGTRKIGMIIWGQPKGMPVTVGS